MNELTFGERAVGLTFNPSDDDAVNVLKKAAAAFIDICNEAREASKNPEVKRLLSIAITDAQSAQMFSVKAVTWQS